MCWISFSRATAIISVNYFGFHGTDFKPFNQAPFFRGIFEEINNVVMSNEYYRVLLSGLFLSVYFDGSLYNLNQILAAIFSWKGKICAVRNNGDLDIIYDFAVETWEQKLFTSGIIPIPVGISFNFRRTGIKKRRGRKNEVQ